MDKPKPKGKAIRLRLSAPKTDVPDAPTTEELRALAAKVSALVLELLDAEEVKDKKNSTDAS